MNHARKLLDYCMMHLVKFDDDEKPKERTRRWTAEREIIADGVTKKVTHVWYCDTPPKAEGYTNLQENGYWDHTRNMPVADDLTGFETIDNRPSGHSYSGPR